MSKTKVITREAKIFEAGNYPDKKVNVTVEDLNNIVNNFTGANIKIEHDNTAFDGALGFCSKIWRIGKELFANISFPEYVWSLMEASDAKKLSVGLSKTLDNITEISIVRTPRVSDAQVFCFSEDAVFTELSSEIIAGKLEELIWDTEGEWGYIYDSFPSDNKVVAKVGGKFYEYSYEVAGIDVSLVGERTEVFYEWQPVTYTNNTKKQKKVDVTLSKEPEKVIEEPKNNGGNIEMTDAERIAQLEEELKKSRMREKISFAAGIIDKYKAEGKLIPASEEYAKAILTYDGENITFNNSQISISDMFVKFLDSQSKIVEFKEVVKSDEVDPAKKETSSEGDNLDPDHVKFMMKKFNMTEEEARASIIDFKKNDTISLDD